MSSPKVSVVIPVYNTEDYVEQTIRSIMGQTLSEIEIITIDDGSSDGSLAVLERLAAEDSRIRVHAQPNGGLSRTRNMGIETARGEFIYFMDSDDLLDADCLEMCYRRCQQDSLDFVFFDAVSFGAPDCNAPWYTYRRAQYFKEPFYTGHAALKGMLDHNCYRATACLSFIRLDFLRKAQLSFYPGILHEDELFTPQLYLSAQRVGGIERPFFHRRLREGSIMNNRFSERNLNCYLTVLEKLHLFTKSHNAETRRVTRRLTTIILGSTLRKAYSLPWKLRLNLAGTALTRYLPCVHPMALATLLFKNPIKKLSGR